ncbi:MAG: SusC/RagA family TonB-linked outer membrane protein [Chitinophagales bacterium]|nr:SusC/RagA family TonB-linked outer membrane protein [Chitinophagales bacterium]
MPQFDVSGKVTDQIGKPLIGVSVTLKGNSTVGTTTDVSGNYSLSLDNGNGTLVFSFVGYLSQEVNIAGQKIINVSLQVNISSLNQVVVVGYGTQRKADLTGAISVVNIKDITAKPVSSVNEMIKGEVPGVTVENSYSPGGGVAVRIRGFSTIRNDDPLYIIDGVPTTGDLNTLNPNDIESMQILKDASSASIYGSRAANGVVIITTKKGTYGKPKISFNSYTGIQSVFHLPKLLNAQQYGEMLWQAIKNDGGTPANDVYGNGSEPVIPEWLDADKTVHSSNVDWMKELFHSAATQSYNLSVSKGSDNSHQYFSVGYYDQAGVMKYTGFKRATARMNTDTKFFNRLLIGENFTIDYTSTTSTDENSVNAGTLYDAFKFPSIAPVKDINGNFAGSPLNDAWNPLGQLFRNKDNRQKNLNLFGNMYVDLKVIDGLHLKSNLGVNYNNSNFRDFSPKYFELGTQQAQSTLTTSNSYNYNLVWSNTADYIKNFGKNNFNVLAGTEAVKFYEEDFSGTRIGFPFDDPNFRYLNAGDGGSQTNTGIGNRWSLLSFFGKIDYNYDQKYLVSATIRRDGSSRLGNNKWGNFPAFSAGWRLSQEPFFHVSFINDLKVRFGWGQNGNQDIPTSATIGGFISDPNNSNYPINGSQNSVLEGFVQSRVPNPNLKWETTTQSNYGVDVSMFNSSVQLTIDYYVKNTRDMLIERPLPLVMGGSVQTFWDNAGTMSNKGLEMDYL